MRIALAQTNPIVGDIAGNCRKTADFIFPRFCKPSGARSLCSRSSQ